MPLSALVNNFNAGELSPFMDARSDVEKYRNGCKTLENFVLLTYGGVMRRPGTEYLGAAKFANRRCRLIGFNFSTTTRFILEFGHLYVRFWSNGVQVQSGGNPVEVASPYTEDQLREVQHVQINDILYIVHPSHPPYKLSRLSDTNWTMAEVAWTWPALLEENLTTTTLTCSHTTGNNRTLTASSSLFNANHVGGYFQIGHAVEASSVERNIDSNGNSGSISVLGEWEFTTSGVWSAELFIDQSDDGGTTWEAIRSFKGSADRNVTVSGKTEREVLLRIRMANYVTGAAWSNNATYAKDDVRVYEGNVYRCVLAHSNTAVAWATTGQTFSVGDIVTYNTRTYKCVRAHNTVVSTYPTSVTVEQILTAGNLYEDNGELYRVRDDLGTDNRTSIIDWPQGTTSLNAIQKIPNRIYRGENGRGFWRCVEFRTGTFSDARTANGVQLLSAQSPVLAHYEMSQFEKMDFRPFNATYWEPIDFTPFNAKYWTPINYETRVARLEKLDSVEYGVVKVTAYNSPTNVTVNVIDPVSKTTATKFWTEGAWSPHQGFPRTVTLHEGRIWYGGTNRRPLSVWASVVDDFENMRLTTLSDGGLFLTLSSKEANRINWIDSQDRLMIGTSGNEWTLGANNPNEGITPANVVAKKTSSYGSKYLPIMSLNDVMLFVQRQGRKVRELTYVLDRDTWVAPDLTVLAEHITAGEIVEVDYQQQTDAIYWAVRGDGTLIGMTYERDQNVVGWHRHTTDGAFESVATIYGIGGADEVWLAVKRTVGGQDVRYIERFRLDSREIFEAQNKPNWWYLDCAVRKTGAASTTVSGLSHLNGRTVGVLVDGAADIDYAVAGGSITLTNPRSTVLVGLPYTSTLQPMTIDVNNLPDGTSRGRKKRMHRLIVSLAKSLGGEFSTNGSTWNWLYPRNFNDPMNASPPSFSGDVEAVAASDYESTLPIIIRQTQPFPLTVLALVAKLDFYGD